MLYVFRCGYCGISEEETGAQLTEDHFEPRSAGGSDDLDNIVYACSVCNEHKGYYWNPGSDERIIHPLRDDVTQHLVERSDGTLAALTVTGRFHIARLRLNRVGLVARRRDRQTLNRVDGRIATLEGELAEVSRQLRELPRHFSLE